MAAAPVAAQDRASPAEAASRSARPALTVLRYDEDWSMLADPARRTEPLDALKWMPLGQMRLSLGGEVRVRDESYSATDLGVGGRGGNDYALVRVETHADLHIDDSVRMFAQLRYTPMVGASRPLGPVQDNGVDLAQGFLDVGRPVGGGAATLRAGRQMIVLRSLLVQPREGPNVKVSFDGVRGFWNGQDGMRIDAFYTDVVQPRAGSFDDGSNGAYRFWGANLTTAGNTPDPRAPGLDLYYLGLHRRAARYAVGAADETRHSLGIRWVGRHRPWDWSAEGTWQFGQFGADRISAAALTARAGLTLQAATAPTLSMSFDMTSGDRRPGDGKLGTFEAPFPTQPYIVQADFVAPSNTIDIHPFLTVHPARNVSVGAGAVWLWKFSRADAFYLIGPRPLTNTTFTGRFVERILQSDLRWQVSHHLSFEASIDYAAASKTLRDLGGRSTTFGMMMTTFKF